MFTLNAKEDADRLKWEETHKKFCEDPRFTYSFSPTGIGIGFRINCVCGVQADLTDYDCW